MVNILTMKLYIFNTKPKLANKELVKFHYDFHGRERLYETKEGMVISKKPGLVQEINGSILPWKNGIIVENRYEKVADEFFISKRKLLSEVLKFDIKGTKGKEYSKLI